MEQITYEEFSKLDMRVARIIHAERIAGYKKILRVKVDLGSEERDLVVGGAEYYKPEDLINKIVIVVANLKPRKIANIESRGMILAADVDGRPVWLSVDGSVPLGSKVR